MGWQLPIRTSDGHGSARIAEIDTRAPGAAPSGGAVAVIPGFQGIAMGERVTTLWRGGSDTSAVAMRSDARRAGREGRSTCRPRWYPSPLNKQQLTDTPTHYPPS